MAKGFTQWLSLTNESAYGVTQTTSPTTDWVRLHGDDAFTLIPTQLSAKIRGADSRNRNVVNVPGRTPVGGRLKCYLYCDPGTGAAVSLADRLLGWATTIATDELSSYTVRHYDGVRAAEYLGAKVAKVHVFAASAADEGLFNLELDLVAQKRNAVDPTFTEPAQNVFAKSPYRLQETAGGVIVATSGSVARTVYRSFDLTITNKLYASWDEQNYISDLGYNGRDIEAMYGQRFTSKADRTAFEAQTSYSISAVLTKASPAHTLTLQLNTANFMGSMDRSLKLGEPTYEVMHFACFDDLTVSNDFSYSVT